MTRLNDTRRTRPITAALLLATAALTACGRSSESPTPVPQTTVATPAAAESSLGPDTWNRGGCTLCHGSNGSGGPLGPNLRDGTWSNCDGSVEGIRAVLISGVPLDKMVGGPWPTPMPPATDLIKDAAEIDALAVYVKSMSQGG
ncbi:MAG: c-type cytochrome [Planctomycetota bacterium]|jgi:mono/diheme cytochrome c family protein